MQSWQSSEQCSHPAYVKKMQEEKKCIGQQMLFFLYCCTIILGTVSTFSCQMQNLFSIITSSHWWKCSREAFIGATITYKYMRNAGFAFVFCHFGFYCTVKSMWNQKISRLNCCKKKQHCTVMYMLQWQATMSICKYHKLHSSTSASVLQTFFYHWYVCICYFTMASDSRTGEALCQS